MNDSKLNKGIELASKAIEAEKAGKLEEAIHLYGSAIDHFMHIIKYERPIDTVKKSLRERCKDYLSRAEALQLIVKEKAKRPVKASAGGEKKKDGDKEDEDDEDEDKETKRLINQLEGSILMTTPNVKWTDVAGLEYAKNALEEAVIFPINYPAMFTGKRKPWKGILLYGPPGTGKSFLAKAVATEANKSTFFSISSSDIMSKWLGESEKMVKNLFKLARLKAPSIIFIDEVDSLCSSRSDGESESSRRIKTEFLVQMQGVSNENGNVLVLGATNLPWSLDDGIRRRFQRRIYIPLPDETARRELFRMNLSENKHQVTSEEIALMAKRTENYSGADISVLVLDAIYEPIRKVREATHFKKVSGPCPKDKNKIVNDLLTPCSPGDPNAIEMSLKDVPADKLLEPVITIGDLEKALSNTRPSVGLEDLGKFEKFTRDFGSDGS